MQEPKTFRRCNLTAGDPTSGRRPPGASDDNPKENRLPPNLSLEEIVEATRSSGYPFQGRVADSLELLLDSPYTATVQDEWTYLDSESGTARALDIRAQKFLWDFAEDPHIRPSVELLVECKQSANPWLFFCRPSVVQMADFPRVGGLPSERIAIAATDGTETSFGVLKTIGLVDDPFVLMLEAPTAHSCARVHHTKGGKLEVTGDAWNAILPPLAKAVDHLIDVLQPTQTARTFDAGLVVPIAVLDAPMIAMAPSRPDDSPAEFYLTPWVRLVRHELDKPGYHSRSPLLSCIDVVHFGYLPRYVQELLRFANEFAGSAKKYGEVLGTGRGYVPSLSAGYHYQQLASTRGLPRQDRRLMQAGNLAAQCVIPFLRRRGSHSRRRPSRGDR